MSKAFIFVFFACLVTGIIYIVINASTVTDSVGDDTKSSTSLVRSV